MSGCSGSGGCGGCGGGSTPASTPTSSPSSSGLGHSCSGDCGCGGSCGDNCSCRDHSRSEVRYHEVPLGLPEDHSEIKKPSDGFYEGMRVYNTNTKERGEVTAVRYKECVVKVDDSEGRSSVYDCRFLIPEEEADAYEAKSLAVMSPAPPNPFEK